MNVRSAAGRKLALPALDAGRLRELVDAAGVTVADRRSRESLIQGLADGRKLDLAQLMHLLSRDELKAMCRALRVTDEGREKALIVARLVGSDDAEPEATDEPSRSSLPWRSQVVSLLKRDELQDLVERLDIEVGDKRVHQQLVDAVAGSDLPIDQVLEDLSRARLKELCRVLGLDDGGKEKAAIIARLAQQAPTGTDEEDDPEDEAESAAHAASNDPGILVELLGAALRVEAAKGWWPAEGTLSVAGQAIPVDIHARSVGATGRNPVERRFQNPANRRPIVARAGRPCLLLGVWTEQGRDRAVIVAFDAYRRLDRGTRFSLFMTQALLEEAADTGFVSHVSGTGEMIFAFRPEALARYLDELAARKTWGALNPGPWALGATAARATTIRPLAPTSASDSVEIRPKAGMFAAFARLNYKPWFALAELVDNAVQSFLAHPTSPWAWIGSFEAGGVA